MPEQENYKFRVRNSTPVDLASGRVVADTEEIELSSEEVAEPHNKRLIDSNVLVSLDEKEPAPEPTEAAIKKADELEVDLAEVKGTGGQNKNQVTVDDVVAFAESRDSSDPDSKEGGN